MDAVACWERPDSGMSPAAEARAGYPTLKAIARRPPGDSHRTLSMLIRRGTAFQAKAGLSTTIGDPLLWRVLPLRDPPRRVDLDPPTVRRRLLAAALDLVILVVIVFGVDVLLAFLEVSRGVDVDTLAPWFTPVQYTVGVLLLVVPMMTADRATPGQATVLLALSSCTHSEPAGPASVAARFAVRWLPILVWGAPSVAVVAVVELTAVAAHSERTSLAGLIGRTVAVTRDRMRLPPLDPPADRIPSDSSPDRAL
jgi:hypothetical protein